MTTWTISDKDDGERDLLAGERLAEARRAADIPVRDIAKELHLDETKVRALEENRFADLGAAVFAKGHLRKYAELVGMSADEIMSDYYSMTRSVDPPPVVGRKRAQLRAFSAGRWIMAVVVAGAIAAAAYWYFSRESGPSTQAPVGAVAPPAAQNNADSTNDAAQPQTPVPAAGSVADAPAQNVAAESVAPAPESVPETIADQADAVATSVATAALDEQTVALTLSFTGECWTEVTDANGARLFFDLGRPGRSITVSGAAPLRVLIGDIDNVALQVNGVDFPVLAANRRGNSALLTIDSN